jgi:hypothetical protein
MIMDLFLLWHTHTDEDLAGGEDFMLIGIYSSYELALSAQRRTEVLPGFCDQKDGFEISQKSLDEDSWTTGFITV